MKQTELAEIARRASLVADDSLSELDRELRALHARNAAKGCLRSGATVKESARIASAVVKRYFDHVESFACSLPSSSVGSDAKVVDEIAPSTRRLLDGLWVSLRKTAALASDENLVVHIKPQVEASLLSTQDLFRSNLRGYLARQNAAAPPTGRLLYYLEVVLFVIGLAFTVVWLLNPTGPYEPFAALFGLIGGGGVDLYRRRAAGRAPN